LGGGGLWPGWGRGKSACFCQNLGGGISTVGGSQSNQKALWRNQLAATKNNGEGGPLKKKTKGGKVVSGESDPVEEHVPSEPRGDQNRG